MTEVPSILMPTSQKKYSKIISQESSLELTTARQENLPSISAPETWTRTSRAQAIPRPIRSIIRAVHTLTLLQETTPILLISTATRFPAQRSTCPLITISLGLSMMRQREFTNISSMADPSPMRATETSRLNLRTSSL